MTSHVRTLNTIIQQDKLTTSIVEHNIDIICVQEHRYYQRELEGNIMIPFKG